MNRKTRTALGVAAGLALTLVALPARADHDRDEGRWRDRDCDHHGPPRAAFVAPAPPAPWPAPAFRPAPWRRAEWRELRAEYRRLDLARDHFYATWDGRPWTRDRFESWYGERRARLEARRAWLERRPDHEWRG